jgi:hypothetical protein
MKKSLLALVFPGPVRGLLPGGFPRPAWRLLRPADTASAARQVIDEPKYRGLAILEEDGAGALRREGLGKVIQ